MTCPRLIEVALPIREISAESVRDKSLRHGHISTLHLWWARRPLSASRAIVFASLVPDPDHAECPQDFKDAVNRFLGKGKVPSILQQYRRGKNEFRTPDPYRPYEGMEDTLRNRLLTFIAKWSPEWIQFEAGKSDKQPGPSEMLDDRCLVKWETSDPENEQGKVILHIAQELIKIAHGGEIPTVLDPFAGGGSIPLEAGRLGCNTIANDYNPVAYLILRATCEYPQKFGKPGRRKGPNGEESEVPNVLAYDVEHWAKWTIEKAKERIGYLYPVGNDGYPVVGYMWARTAPCSNPNCKAEIPLLRSMMICDKPSKKVALRMTIDKPAKIVTFSITKEKAITRNDGTMQTRGNVLCPICEQTTPVKDLRAAGLEGKLGERMVAVITDTPQGKVYRSVESCDLMAFEQAEKLAQKVNRPSEFILPEINSESDSDKGNSTGIRVHLYGMKTWGALFNPRQIVAVQTFCEIIREASDVIDKEYIDTEYKDALRIYLGLWLSRIATFQSNVGRWRNGVEAVASPFSMQAIPMIWDYPEMLPLSEISGGQSQLDWILKVILHEQAHTNQFSSNVFCGDGAYLSTIQENSCDTVITDPPYFDAIAYSDLSDFFYVWLKRLHFEIKGNPFSTPLSPKSEEATALKHRHLGNTEIAVNHFTSKLAACFYESKRVTKSDGIISVMFAHQSTEAWTALINSLFEAGLNITATYPIDTERGERMVALDASALASSITAVCRKRVVGSTISYKDVCAEIEEIVAKSVDRYWRYGFRGADLIVACYGPAVGVFGRYEKVVKGDDTVVPIRDLLEFVRKSALKAIAGEFAGDHLSRLYFVWVNLYGTTVQKYDDARLVVQIGGGDDVNIDIAKHEKLFIIDGSDCRLALLADRSDIPKLGREPESPQIDRLHFAMKLWQAELRSDLIGYLRSNDLLEDERFWKLAQALFEVLPRTEADWKLVAALLSERDTLKLEARKKLPVEPDIGQSRKLDLPTEE